MELFDLYDRNRNLIGTNHKRGEAIPDGSYHLVISVWIKNRNGKYLISKRSPEKKNYPNMWECTCGNIQKGEDTFNGAIREVKEELGIDLNKENMTLAFSEILEDLHYIYDVYICEYNGRVNLKKASCDEVVDTRWVTKSQIENLYLKGLFRDDLTHFFHLIEPGRNYTYIVECKDGTYYTGWSNDLQKRIAAHNAGIGAKYTKNRRPVRLVYYEEFDTKVEAMQREYAIKQLTRKEKEQLIKMGLAK